MKEPHIGVVFVDLTYANDNQRRGELDELMAELKRVMIDAIARRYDFAALPNQYIIGFQIYGRLRSRMLTAADVRARVQTGGKCSTSYANDENSHLEGCELFCLGLDHG